MGICQTEGNTQTVHYWLGELLQAGRHEDATGKSRRVVSQTSTDGDLETMETDTNPWALSHEIGYCKIQGMGMGEH